MPYCMCWQQLLVVWIHHCVKMGFGFHFHKVNLNIAVYYRIWVNAASPTSTWQPHGHQGTIPKPLWKTIYPDQSTSPRVFNRLI